jgi:hypothetical protein
MLHAAWVTIRVGIYAQVSAPLLLAPWLKLAGPVLAPTVDGGGVVVFRGFLPETATAIAAWEKLDATGAVVAGPLAIGAFTHDRSASLVPLGTGNVLVNLTGDPSRLSYMRLDAAGTSLGPFKPIAAEPGNPDRRAVRRGSDIIVAWGSPVFGMARLTLDPIADAN